MKNSIVYRLRVACMAFAAAFFATGCDNIYIEEEPGVGDKPSIESFSPTTGVAGTEIVILGSGLNAVNRATIGGREVTISERVSDKRLSIQAGISGASGTIVLYNAAGSCESASVFTYIFPVPSLLSVTDATTGEPVVAAAMDQHLMLEVENSAVVQSVWFTAADETMEGSDLRFEAQIASISHDDGLIEVIVPYVNSDDASILLQYYDGTAEAYTNRDAAQLTVARNAPKFIGEIVSRAAAGMPVTVEGENLHHVQHIYVGDYEALIDTQSSTSLRFIVPEEIVAGQSDDFESEALTIRAEYFFGNEEQTLSENFTVFVATLNFWPGRNVWAQGRIEYSGFRSFFSPETGIVYHNSRFITEVDPVAYAHKSTMYSSNVRKDDKLTRAEYESIAPYFFFTAANAGTLAINSPSNSDSQLKNFYTTTEGTADQARVLLGNITMTGTPIVLFRELSETNAAQKAVIDQVKSGTLSRIDEESFPINIAKKQIAGISLPTSGARTTANWAPGYTAGTNVDGFNADAVLLMTYMDYDYPGSSDENAALYVKRIGFVHIRTVNFRVLPSGANTPPSGSDITFDCYWQKRDYDYSKLAE